MEVLAGHPWRDDVQARLVELDARNTAVAQAAALAAGLDKAEIVTGDASLTDQYRGLVSADLVLACGGKNSFFVRRVLDDMSSFRMAY
jgi:hypothetical protein